MSMSATSENRVLPPTKRILLILFVVLLLAGLNALVGWIDLHRIKIPNVFEWEVFERDVYSAYTLSLGWTVGAIVLVLFYILQVAFVSFFCGRSNDPTWLKWIVFAWIFALIDIEILARMPIFSVDGESLPIVSLFAGQFGLLTVWLVMGSNHIVQRFVFAIPPLVGLWMLFAQSKWWLLFPCVVVPLFIVLIVLRVFRFRLVKFAGDGQADDAAARQFSLAHAMILMTVLAVMMAALKSQEALLRQLLLRLASIAGIIRDGDSAIGLIIVLGFSSAIAAVASCWAALGFGKPIRRYGVLLLVVVSAGIGVSVWATRFLAAHQAGGWRSRRSYELVRFAEGRWLWLAWFLASGLLLVATLLFLRWQGLRFVRSAKTA